MKFKARAGASSVTYGGKEHEVDDDGLVDLPADAAEHIAPHGFTPHIAEGKDGKSAKDKADKSGKGKDAEGKDGK